MNTIGSKVVIRPLTETLELPIKKDQLLQWTMKHTDPAKASQDDFGDLPSGEMPVSSGAVATGDLPPGEITEATEDLAVGDSPSGAMPQAEGQAEELAYLPSGKRSRTEAKEEEDVETQDQGEQHQEEIPQDDPMDAPDYGAEDIDDDGSETESVMMTIAIELLNFQLYEAIADEENIEGEPSNLEQWPRIAHPAMARFFHNMLGQDLREIDGLLRAETRMREERHVIEKEPKDKNKLLKNGCDKYHFWKSR